MHPHDQPWRRSIFTTDSFILLKASLLWTSSFPGTLSGKKTPLPAEVVSGNIPCAGKATNGRKRFFLADTGD